MKQCMMRLSLFCNLVAVALFQEWAADLCSGQALCILLLIMLQDFHGRYYHPSNARFWFYGDDPADERLHLLSKYLDEFEARPVDSTVHAQPLRQVKCQCILAAGSRDAHVHVGLVNFYIS